MDGITSQEGEQVIPSIGLGVAFKKGGLREGENWLLRK